MEAVALMNQEKVVEPSVVMAELLNVCKKEFVRRLNEVVNNTLQGNNTPEYWRKCYLIPIFQGKGDVRSCGNYKSIQLLQHGMKVIERICEKRLRKIVELNETQLDFMPGKGSTDANSIMRQ